MEKLNSQERILIIVEKSVEGMSNKAVAFELKTLEANVCRDLKILETHG
jgi:DNA-binding NarL/FixJ family response regulator